MESAQHKPKPDFDLEWKRGMMMPTKEQYKERLTIALEELTKDGNDLSYEKKFDLLRYKQTEVLIDVLIDIRDILTKGAENEETLDE